jgi:hypothetical protein
MGWNKLVGAGNDDALHPPMMLSKRPGRVNDSLIGIDITIPSRKLVHPHVEGWFLEIHLQEIRPILLSELAEWDYCEAA